MRRTMGFGGFGGRWDSADDGNNQSAEDDDAVSAARPIARPRIGPGAALNRVAKGLTSQIPLIPELTDRSRMAWAHSGRNQPRTPISHAQIAKLALDPL